MGKIATTIYETVTREGFARKTLMHRKLKKGEIARVRIRKKDSFVSPGSTIRQEYLYPAEYKISGVVPIDHAEIEQDPELANDVAVSVLEDTMVKEDRVWKGMVDKIASQQNFTTFAEMIAALKANNVPPGMWLFGSSVWPKLITSENLLDPATKRKLVKNGKINSLYGIPIHTDAFRDPSLKVLNHDDVYLVAKPKYFGIILDRIPLDVEEGNDPTGKAQTNISYNQVSSMTIGNIRSAVRRKV